MDEAADSNGSAGRAVRVGKSVSATSTGALQARTHCRRIALGVLTVSVFVGAVAAGFTVAAWQQVGKVHITTPGSARGGTTYLIIGSDSRSFVKSAADRQAFGSSIQVPGERADLILLVRVERTGQVRILPIPRDLVVQLPDGAPVRITLTLLHGPQGLVDSLCQSLGIAIDHLVLVHFNGLQRIVDALGGITVGVSAPLRDAVSGLQIMHAGANHLDGRQALAYVRSRQPEAFENGKWSAVAPAADGRSDHAREVLNSLGSKLGLSATSPWAGARKIWAVTRSVEVDDSLSPFSARKVGQALSRMPYADELTLGAALRPGDIPTAYLPDSARGVIARFSDGATPGCSFRPIQSPSSTQPTGNP